MENENTLKDNENLAKNIVRPWQGTTLGVFLIIYSVLLGMIMLPLFVGGNIISNFINANDINLDGMTEMQANQAASLFGMGFAMFGVILLPFLVLSIFMALGSFKGQKWAIVVSLIFSGIAILTSMADIGFSLFVNAFVIYLGIICVQHPYYNQKK